MTRLDRYVWGELLPPLLAGTLMFTAILSFGYFFISSQFLKNAPVGLIGRWIAYQVPDTLVKVLPMAVVLMVVVAFGRMSAERELIAVRSGGIGLGRLAHPAALTALLVTALSVWLSLWIAPRANLETRSLYWDSLTGAGLQQFAGRNIDLGNNLILGAAGYDAGNRALVQPRLEQWSKDNPQQATIIFGDSATFEDHQISVKGYQIYTVNYAAAAGLSQVPEGDAAALSSALQRVFPAVQIPEDKNAPLVIDTGLSRKEAIAKYADALGADAEGWPELITKLTAPGVETRDRDEARASLNRKLALPFGNLVLALAALPFALRLGRSLGVSLGIALLVALAYYLLFFVGLTIAGQAAWLSELGTWLPNVLFFLLGLWLLRRT